MNPKDEIRTLYFKGRSLIDEGEHTEGMIKFTRITKICPKLRIPYSHSYYTMFKQGEYKELLRLCKRAARIKPRNKDLLFHYWGYSLYEQRQYNDAIPKLKQAIGDWSYTKIPYIYWSLCLYHQNLEREAAQIFKEGTCYLYDDSKLELKRTIEDMIKTTEEGLLDLENTEEKLHVQTKLDSLKKILTISQRKNP